MKTFVYDIKSDNNVFYSYICEIYNLCCECICKLRYRLPKSNSISVDCAFVCSTAVRLLDLAVMYFKKTKIVRLLAYGPPLLQKLLTSEVDNIICGPVRAF